MFRALCHQLWEIVEDRFPDSRHSAVGSFIFLRFFCPAIVSPEAIDLAISAESREVRRALLLITKVIQNLANNVKFKESHMQILNTFLAENIKQVTRFLSDVAVSVIHSSSVVFTNSRHKVRPRGWELAQAVKVGADEAERSQEGEVDNVTLYVPVSLSCPSLADPMADNASFSRIMADFSPRSRRCLHRIDVPSPLAQPALISTGEPLLRS